MAVVLISESTCRVLMSHSNCRTVWVWRILYARYLSGVSCTHSINPFLPPHPSPASALHPPACWPRSALTETSRMDRYAAEEACGKRMATRFVRPLLHLKYGRAPPRCVRLASRSFRRAPTSRPPPVRAAVRASGRLAGRGRVRPGPGSAQSARCWKGRIEGREV